MASYNEHAVKQRYSREPPSEEVVVGYLKAVKIIIGADGEIAEGELKALRRGLTRLGVSQRIRQQIEDFDFTSARLEDVLPNMKQGGLRARMLLRDAVEISSADGVYAKEEKEAVARAALLLGVDAPTLKAIEALVELERGARHLRKALFPKQKKS